MQIIKYISIGLLIIDCFAVIIVTMMQSKEDSGLSGTITGSSTNNFYEKNKGRTKEGKLKKWTLIFGVIFAIISVVLEIIYPMN